MNALRISLAIVGLVFLLGPTGVMVMTDSFPWHPWQPEYHQMLLGFYGVLGLFLLEAARQPLRHRSLIWFTVWSSLVLATIITLQAWDDAPERYHLTIEVPFLIVVALMLAALIPKLGGAWRL